MKKCVLIFLIIFIRNNDFIIFIRNNDFNCLDDLFMSLILIFHKVGVLIHCKNYIVENTYRSY